MKTTIFLTAFLACSILHGQDQLLAKVKRVKGVEVYILSTPVRQYEIVGDRKHQRSVRMPFKEGPGKQTIGSKVDIIVDKMTREAEKEGMDFDAILYEDGKYAYPIKFTDEPAPDTKGMAKATRLNGLPVFIMCEPEADYSIVSDKRKKRNFKSFVTMGWDKQSIREAATKWAKRFHSQVKKGKVDAVYYNYGKAANGIYFE